jgi:hypothetical protein
MTAARKLVSDRTFVPVIVSPQPRIDAFVDGLQVLGWSNLPVAAHDAVRSEMKQFLDELVTKTSSTDPELARRRKRTVFWVDAFLRGDCSLAWMLEMLES